MLTHVRHAQSNAKTTQISGLLHYQLAAWLHGAVHLCMSKEDAIMAGIAVKMTAQGKSHIFLVLLAPSSATDST